MFSSENSDDAEKEQDTNGLHDLMVKSIGYIDNTKN